MFGGISKVLSQRDFAIYWSSNGVNTVGRWMYRIAVAWLAWELTKSTVWLGIVAFAESIPLVIFSVVAGAMADRVGYIRITILRRRQQRYCRGVRRDDGTAGPDDHRAGRRVARADRDPESLTTPARALVRLCREITAAAIGLTGATFNGSTSWTRVAGILISLSGQASCWRLSPRRLRGSVSRCWRSG